MDTINTFEGGMQSDASKSYVPKNSYPQALNFRPVTELGDSSGSLVNIKGNECKITFPTTQDVFKLKVTDNGGTTNDTITITVGAYTTSAITITEATTGYEIYTLLKALPNCYETSNTTPVTTLFGVAYGKDYVIIYQKPEYTGCGPTSNSSFPTITVNRTAVSIKNTLMFIDTGGNAVLTQNIGSYILTHNNLIIIGHTFIGDDIYIFTEDQDGNIPVNDSFTGVSFIWKLNINDVTKVATLKIIYIGYLDFTKEHPIPPSAATGRYESDKIQRIYWSDFYNKIRTLNVADPQAMALDPKQLSVTPNVEFTQSVLNNIIAGSLPSGNYQLGFRYKKDFGSVSSFSELSNMTLLYSAAIGDQYYANDSTGNSNKGLEYIINNLDPTFDRIEPVLIYRADNVSTPEIYSVDINGIVINANRSVTIRITSLDDLVDITLDEFLVFSGTFTHAKTCDTKDNRLFWGNVKVADTKSLDEWDARAFRAYTSNASSTDIKLKNGGTNTNHTLAQAIARPETDDCINEYFDVNGELSTSTGCYFKPDSAIANVLGGKGANVSYEFGTWSVMADDLVRTGTSDPYQINATIPFLETNNNGTANSGTNIVLNDSATGIIVPYEYHQQNSNNITKTPYKSGLLKGYQHEEVYRFGIQFFDLNGAPMFTKWIGDIKFPSYADNNNNSDSGVTDFRLSYQNGGSVYMQIMYIKFDVDISTIKDLISGYQIVRVERTSDDETILGVGTLTAMMGEGNNPAAANLYLPSCVETKSGAISYLGGIFFANAPFLPGGFGPSSFVGRYLTSASTNPAPMAHMNSDNSQSDRFFTFDSYDVAYKNGITYSNGDRILIRDSLVTYNYNDLAQGYWKVFSYTTHDQAGNTVPGPGTFLYNTGTSDPPTGNTIYDNTDTPFTILKFRSESLVAGSPAVATNNYASHIFKIKDTQVVGDGGNISIGGRTFYNYSRDFGTTTNIVNYGILTQALEIDTAVSGTLSLYSTYGCTDVQIGDLYKVLSLYFRPRPNQYGGNTYAQRANSIYFPCSEFIPAKSESLNVNDTIVDFKVFGGDVFTTMYDMQKASKGPGVEVKIYDYNSASIPPSLNALTCNFNNSISFYIPITCRQHSDLRYGNHIETGLTSNTYSQTDTFTNNTANLCENNVRTYIPKPLVYNNVNKWINRVYYSQVKFNNETQDSWSNYQTNDFYDVEGNYGEINCLISLNNQLHYIQERGIGMLLVNPVAMVSTSIDIPIKLGSGDTIQRHEYRALDVGTKHQWSVYKSQSQVVFLDVRTKKLYSYTGSEIKPISDLYGQRNFIIKRLHNDILNNDNPIKGKGVITMYDYYHNEFLITFLDNTDVTSTEEFYTIAFNERTDRFTSYYSFLPNVYLTNHKYLLSNINDSNRVSSSVKKSIYLHNYGTYGNFYGTAYKSTIKNLVNDNPLYTKIFDYASWMSDSIKDNIEWSDDKNIYPSAITNPAYPDDVNYKDDTFTRLRCYNDYQNSDWITLTTAKPNFNLRRVERSFNTHIPRNKFNYDANNPSTYSIFDPARLTKTTFGERFSDKYMVMDLEYPNTNGNRFVIHNLKTTYRISDR